MDIVVNYDSSITNSPLAQSIEAAVSIAVAEYSKIFTDPVTITLNFGFGEVDNQPVPASAAAASISVGGYLSYATLQSALASHSVLFNSTSTPLSSLLPAVDPTHGGQFFVTYAEQKALGLVSADSAEVDGYVGLSSALAYSWDQAMISGSSTVDAVGAIEHEMSEIMGRLGFLGITTPNIYGPMDLFRYSSANGSITSGRDLISGPGYFSLDGINIPAINHSTANASGAFGTLVPAQFNNPKNGGDVADWTPSLQGGDSFGSAAFGVANPIGSTDVAILEALGWTRSTLPDLTINNLNIGRIAIHDGTNFTVNYDLDNVGFAATGASSTAIILSADPTMTNYTVIGVVSETGLSGDATRKDKITVTLPTNIVPGVYYISVLADVNDAVSESNNANNYSTNVVKITVSAAPVLTSAILMQNLGGQMAVWQTDSGTMASSGLIGPNPGPSWSAMGTGAFYAGDTSDIIWQNHSGAVAIWQVQGTAVLGGGIVDADPGPSWHIKGTGNFYGDGNTDIFWQNDNGSVAIWDMQGTTIVQSGVVATNPGPTWHVEGTGDFYGDGNTDILWQNDNGLVSIWDMKGTVAIQSGVVAVNPGYKWHIKGTGDFYGDGNTDILWQNDNGSVAIWDMKGTAIVQSGVVATNPGPTWHIEGTGNFYGDGNTDILLQNDNGSVAIWDMKGASITAATVLANPSAAWNVIGSGAQMQFICSTSANETLTATPTTSDEFIFTNFAAGAHTIAGFNAIQDRIELSGASFASFAAVQAATTAVAGGAMIALDHFSSLLLTGVSATSLHASNFAFA